MPTSDGYFGYNGCLFFYHKNMRVQSMKKETNSWSVEETLNLSRAIIVEFKNHGFKDEMIYHLSETHTI